MHSIDPKKLSAAIVQDTRRQLCRGELRGWEIGARPTHPMAHFEYAVNTESVAAAQRSASCVVPSQTMSIADRVNEREKRRAVAAAQGFGAAPTEPYAPLGELQQAVEPLNFLLGRHGGLVLVEPEAERNANLEDAQQATPLVLGQTVTSMVRKHEYAYYWAEKPPGKVLRISVHTIRGDPDLYVCNRTKAPSHEEHTWRATGIGDDSIEIDPTEEQAARGARFYIGVYGIQDTSFQLGFELAQKEIRVPVRRSTYRPKAYTAIQKEVVNATRRKQMARQRSGLLDELQADMKARGFEPAVVQASPPSAE